VLFENVWFKDGYIKMWYCYLCTICVNYDDYVDAMFKMLLYYDADMRWNIYMLHILLSLIQDVSVGLSQWVIRCSWSSKT
jgi:hypothetical protein